MVRYLFYTIGDLTYQSPLVFESKTEGSRRMVRPGLRWLEDVQKDLRKIRFERRRQKAIDREEWASVFEEAKALRGP